MDLLDKARRASDDKTTQDEKAELAVAVLHGDVTLTAAAQAMDQTNSQARLTLWSALLRACAMGRVTVAVKSEAS